MRVLVTVSPQMYRQAVAIAILRHRPDAEVLIASPEDLDGQARSFAPHAVVRNDDGEQLDVPEGVVCWVGVLITDSMNARISVGGRVTGAHDVSIEKLIAALDEAEALVEEEDGVLPA
ncbi:MAG: hypothetical protein M3Q49_19650 [Actinomycetota bacterium]|nr:hypothetical protein [Actinomycetota bacterium]